MSRTFPPIRSKIKTSDNSGVMKKFMGAIGEGYIIRAFTNQENFYTMLNSLNEILVSVEAMRASLIFP